MLHLQVAIGQFFSKPRSRGMDATESEPAKKISEKRQQLICNYRRRTTNRKEHAAQRSQKIMILSKP